MRSHRSSPPIALVLACAVILLAGCIDIKPFPAAAQHHQEALLAVPDNETAPTPAIEDGQTIAATREPLATPLATGDAGVSPDALRYVFPTPGPAPKSAWRPPLYPVPWALTPYDHFYFTRPIAADEVNWPLWDYRYGGIFFGSDIVHTGIDIDAPMGTPVLAAAAGTVVWAGYGLYSGVNNPNDPYGQAVALRHDFGYKGQRLYTIYAHMSAIEVKVGDMVQDGQEIGQVGDTGFTTGPHLHFEVRLNANDFFYTRNPELWLAPPQGWGVLAGRVMNTDGSLLSNHQVLVRVKNGISNWTVRTYGSTTVHSDDYYQENMVLSDLPAGTYEVWVAYFSGVYKIDVQINPGMVTYFTFRGNYLFKTATPPPPEGDFIPQAVTPAP
jgi:murein DD-endopeptidase MepM/ murein hydrolase activator NlpD